MESSKPNSFLEKVVYMMKMAFFRYLSLSTLFMLKIDGIIKEDALGENM